MFLFTILFKLKYDFCWQPSTMPITFPVLALRSKLLKNIGVWIIIGILRLQFLISAFLSERRFSLQFYSFTYLCICTLQIITNHLVNTIIETWLSLRMGAGSVHERFADVSFFFFFNIETRIRETRFFLLSRRFLLIIVNVGDKQIPAGGNMPRILNCDQFCLITCIAHRYSRLVSQLYV